MVNAIIDRGLNLLPSGGEVYYIPGVFSRDESNEYFNELFSDVRWKQEPVKIFGREMMQPRLTAWHGDTDKPYTYSGLTMEAAAWIQPLMRMKKVADEYSGVVSTSALLNLYRDGWVGTAIMKRCLVQRRLLLPSALAPKGYSS